MDATRRRLGSVVEWGIAGACAITAAALLTLGVRGVRDMPDLAVSAREAAAAVPSTVIPAGVVPVPLLSFGEGVQVRLGERLSDVVARLGNSRLLSETLDTSEGKARLTRFYENVGLQFIVVFDGTADDPSAPLSAIFIR
jgi:hypothetical protein